MRIRPVRVFVYLAHTLFIAFSFLPGTKISDGILQGQYKLLLFYTITYVLLMIFYKKSTGSPYYVSNDEAELDNAENLFYCEKCQHYCPLRASHCKHCNKCVLRKDHHCPFLDQCVGMGNHFYFLIFLGLLIIYDSLTIYIFSNSMKDDQDLEDWFVSSLPCNIAYFGAMISIFQPIILFPTHLYLAFTNQTTWELLKGTSISYLSHWHHAMGPFSRGLLKNFTEFCIMHITRPSYKVPTTEEEMDQWKYDNSFITNDKYDC